MLKKLLYDMYTNPCWTVFSVEAPYRTLLLFPVMATLYDPDFLAATSRAPISQASVSALNKLVSN